MNSKSDLDPSFTCSNDRRNVKFFEITGRTLVHPIAYRMQEFQKNVIMTGILSNTLICLPPGLGKLYIAAVIVFNFQRWFVNGKIIVLSQTRSYLTDLIHAFSDYTPLSKDAYADLSATAQTKDCVSAWEKSTILTSPQKLLDMLNQNIGKIHNVVLLLIFETNKIMKSSEYKEILERLCNYEYRILLFIEPVGFNSKTIRQIVEEFNISKVEIKNLDSVDVRECTFRTHIESVAVDISPHIVSIKDSFYAVFEKYGKNLKDAKVISGNVASLTRSQILKAKEKFLKNPPLNLPKAERDELLDCMTMCSFLCHGIELLHNWGVRVFYNYLFDDEKDAELKCLIVKDDHLMSQMKLLNEYLKANGKKLESSLSLIVHPKLIHLKNVVTKCFSDTESDIESVRIIVVCSLDDVVDEIDRLFHSLPNFVRYHCIKTKAKCLASEPTNKEVVKNFLDGVISVLVLSNLVDEVMEVKTSLIVSLDPNKTLLRTADARFFEGAEKCIFILTKGTEFLKFESLLNEKRNEQKPLDVCGIDCVLKESPQLFPSDFCPRLECTGINAPKKDFKNSPGQKTMLHYLKSNLDCSSPSLFESSVASRKSNTPTVKERFSNVDSPSLFTSDHDFDFSTPSVKHAVSKLDDVNSDFDFISDTACDVPQSLHNKHLANFNAKTDELDSFDELILDFSPTCLKDTPIRKSDIKNSPLQMQSGNGTPAMTNRKKFSWTKKSTSNLKIPSTLICDSLNKSTSTLVSKPEVLNETFADYLFPDSPETAPIADRNVLKTDVTNDKESMYNETRGKSELAKKTSIDTLFSDSSSFEVILDTRDHNNTSNNATRSANFLFSRCDKSNNSKVTLDTLASDSSLECSITESVERTDLRKESMAGRNLVDSLFADSPSPEKINDSLSNTSKFNNISFVDDLFADSPSPAQINDTDNVVEVVQPRLFADKLPTPSSQSSEVDSDCDLVPGSPETNRKTCDVFSSRSIETLTASQNSLGQSFCTKNMSPDKVRSSSGNLPPSTSKQLNSYHLFPDSVNSTVNDLRCSFKEQSTLSDFLLSNVGSNKSAPEPAISFTEVPNEFLSRFLPESLAPVDSASIKIDTAPRQSTSPILFSSRKSNRKSSTNVTNNQSSSIKFDSSFDVSEDQLLQIDDITKSKIKSDVVKPVRSVTDISFDTLFGDDSIFRNIPENAQKADLSPIGASKPVNKTNSSTPILKHRNGFESNSSPRGCLTPKNSMSGKCGALVNGDAAHERPSTPKRVSFVNTEPIQSTDVTPEGLKFPPTDFVQDDDSKPNGVNSNTSSPDSLIFANYSTPEELRSNATTSANEKNVSPRKELLYLRMSSTKLGSGDRRVSESKITNTNFSDGSFDLGNYSTPRRLQLKPMSPVINCDSARSSDRVSSTTNTPINGNGVEVSTMDRLHAMNGGKSDGTNAAKGEKQRNGKDRSPLFDDSDAYVDSPLPKFPLAKQQRNRPLFANYAQLMKHKVDQANARRRALLSGRTLSAVPSVKDAAAVPNVKDAVDSDDDFTWMKKSPCSSAAKSTTPCFKKPEPFINRDSASRHSTPVSNRNSDSGSSSTPDLPIPRRPRKRGKLKRNLVEQFFNKEAEVSDDGNDDDDDVENCSQLSVDSFIDDESTAKPSNITNYLKSLKSPQNDIGKFHIPVLSESRLKVNVCSQIEDYEQSYENDSFCVDEYESDFEDECAPSILTQMEERLKKRKFGKVKPKPRSFKRIIEDSSPDSPEVRKKSRQRIKCFISSDSD